MMKFFKDLYDKIRILLFSEPIESPSPSKVFNDMDSLPPELKPLLDTIESEFNENPPCVAIIGLSGVGKSSTINAMFNTNLNVSATTRGTSKFQQIKAQLDIKRSDAKGKSAYLQVYDAPGLGEDLALDPDYLQMYESILPKCDVVIWIVAARNRALALDQQYLERLSPFLNKTIFAISQVDLVDPLDWIPEKNLPSASQLKHIDEIVKDRSQKISKYLGRDIKCVPFSSKKYYGLMNVYQHIIENAPEKRRWLFELVRAFDSSNWLVQASGLSDDEKRAIVERFEDANPSINTKFDK